MKLAKGTPDDLILISSNLDDREVAEKIEEFKKHKGNETIFVDAEGEKFSKAVLDFRTNGAWQDFVAILLNNGYEISCGLYGDEVEITWKDKIGRIVITEKKTSEEESED